MKTMDALHEYSTEKYIYSTLSTNTVFFCFFFRFQEMVSERQSLHQRKGCL